MKNFPGLQLEAIFAVQTIDSAAVVTAANLLLKYGLVLEREYPLVGVGLEADVESLFLNELTPHQVDVFLNQFPCIIFRYEKIVTSTEGIPKSIRFSVDKRFGTLCLSSELSNFYVNAKWTHESKDKLRFFWSLIRALAEVISPCRFYIGVESAFESEVSLLSAETEQIRSFSPSDLSEAELLRLEEDILAGTA